MKSSFGALVMLAMLLAVLGSAQALTCYKCGTTGVADSRAACTKQEDASTSYVACLAATVECGNSGLQATYKSLVSVP